jgi:hypothetical protein
VAGAGGEADGGAVVLRFRSAEAAEAALERIQRKEGMEDARLGWRPFSLELAGLPPHADEDFVRGLLGVKQKPYSIVLSPGAGESWRAMVNFMTRPAADMAADFINASGLPNVEMRKVRRAAHACLE